MAKIIITDKCTNCRKCTLYCPMDILYMDKEKQLQTQNENTCIECLSCEVVCPYDAIFITPAYSPNDHESLRIIAE